MTHAPPPALGLHQVVAAHARSTPHRAAVVDGDRVLDYAKLDRVADGWAARLQAAGVRPGERVAILLPRRADAVVALLAVLKTGAAYALLDPTWPAERVAEMTADLDARLVVTAPEVHLDLGVPVWRTPTEPVAADFTPVPRGGSDACCVFFTSGTTGRPKGVETPHRAIARLVEPGSFGQFGPDAVVPLAAPTPWDAFALELWAPLLTGGTAVVVAEKYLSPSGLRDCVARHGVTTVWLTSSVFNLAVDEDPGAFAGLRQVITGGERLSPDHVRRFLRAHPTIPLLNGYGPVENTVFATTHPIALADCDDPDGIPLGTPVPGTNVHVLDRDRPCGPGEVGEICLSGTGLALGYLGGRDQGGFTEVTLDGVPTRVYRTGDLGARRADGVLTYRGRADRQVKVRGHRVEPAEVEQRVQALLGVRGCRVVARHDDRGAVRDLVAFCVDDAGSSPPARAEEVLRDALLPHHRPAEVVTVAAFPLTPQGKLDERALLALLRPDADDEPAEAPEDATLRLVVDKIGEVLGRGRVSPTARFGDLGGGSLDAGRVCARLGAATGVPIPLSRFHRHSTATELADWLATATATVPTPPPVGDVPLTPTQLAHLTHHLVEPADRTGHCLLTWVLDGEVDLDALDAAIAAVHQRHEALSAAYLPDPGPCARPSEVEPPPLELLAECASPDAALAAVRGVLAEKLDPTAADVWRVVLAEVRPGSGAVLGIAVHHVAFDGASESVLAHDLAAAYNGEPLGDPPPTLARAHADRADALAAADPAAAGRLRAELAGVPDLRWPERPAAHAGRAPGLVEVDLPGVGTDRVAPLLAAYGAALAEVTGVDDVAVGVPVAQRGTAGLAAAVGCHITTVCVRLRGPALAGDAEAADQALAAALATQDVPFTEALAVAATTGGGRPPLFQTLFAVQDNPPADLPLRGVATRFVRQPYLDLPLELHAELWPLPGGGTRLTVYHRRDAVPDRTAAALAEAMKARLTNQPTTHLTPQLTEHATTHRTEEAAR
ncbi:amino acid adenylation domain-containing protein [Actinokineospora sp. NBRC 105648]|uniref:amino acid adenylation domain-containing protein n=1 Tax=Actinokineospora sp. NBRC 105648 TaxID=3032206 RepID=UPI0024A34904|nr:amino acid adenylation domain-containing protein [Actinokineospora sp. NBRC 105648]GLZ38109.1 amino acid adenylation protein [Actinokineospora sp. NBRC 105648]